MKVKGISEAALRECLERVNREHSYQLRFNREPELNGNWLIFTIRSEKSGIPGSRNTRHGRRSVSASWRAHGYLFDEILRREPDAIIYSGTGSDNKPRKIYKDQSGEVIGNWENIPVSSCMQPCMMSDCDIL